MLALKKIVQLFIFIIFISNCSAKNYCGSGFCNNSKQHTLCKFQYDDPARHCFEYEKTIKTNKEKQAILDKLNSRRNKVAAGEIRSLPSAADMMKLEWNNELELSAQRWANQCVKHSAPDIKDTCRDLGSVFVGQNIATIYGEAPGLTPLALVDVWYMELLNINATVLARYQPSSETEYSHYDYFTQLVWAKAKQVGCGGVKFKERLQDPLSERKRAVYRLVCNFMPGGNILNQSIYTEGPPCSRCSEGACDSVHKSLCSSSKVKHGHVDWTEYEPTSSLGLITRNILIGSKKSGKDSEINRIKSEELKPPVLSEDDNDDVLTPFGYYPSIGEFVRPMLSTTARSSTSCKDMLVVDDFVELLKKKLRTDPMFKDFIQTSSMSPENLANVLDAQALVSKIYSKNVPSFTTKSPEREYVNSTLLVDLVEAIIFRNADKLKHTTETIKSIPPRHDVSPIKIQAELAEVRQNPDFSGHLFFPEDLENDDVSTENTELYYDLTNPSFSDVEMGNIKPSKATRDFLDEILESESIPETHTTNLLVQNRRIRFDWKTFDALKRYKRMTSSQNIYYDPDYIDNIFQNYNFSVPSNFKKGHAHDCKKYVIKYYDLLQKLASDLKVLKLNERFHCARCNAQKYSASTSNILMILHLISINLSFGE